MALKRLASAPATFRVACLSSRCYERRRRSYGPPPKVRTVAKFPRPKKVRGLCPIPVPSTALCSKRNKILEWLIALRARASLARNVDLAQKDQCGLSLVLLRPRLAGAAQELLPYATTRFVTSYKPGCIRVGAIGSRHNPPTSKASRCLRAAWWVACHPVAPGWRDLVP